MATAKPKVKRMMVGGAAKGMGKLASQMGAQMQTQRAQMKSTPPPAFPAKSGVGNAAAALRKLPMNPPMPGKAGPKPMQTKSTAPTFQIPVGLRSSVADSLRKAPTSNSPSELGNAMRGLGVGAAGLARGMMKKGGAVKKKATKK